MTDAKKPDVWDFIRPGDGSRADMFVQASACLAGGLTVYVAAPVHTRADVAYDACASTFPLENVLFDTDPRLMEDGAVVFSDATRWPHPGVGWVIGLPNPVAVRRLEAGGMGSREDESARYMRFGLGAPDGTPPSRMVKIDFGRKARS